MGTFGHFALLTLAVLGLAAAATRVSGRMTPVAAERVMGAAVLATTTAVLSSLLLGVFGIGTAPLPLTGVAVGAWLATRALVSAPNPALRTQLAEWWGSQGTASRALLGAVTGAVGVWAVWSLKHPVITTDGLHYHLADVAAWVQSGRPGALDRHVYLFPVEAYPKTAEVAFAWACGIARSPVPWQPMMVGYFALTAIGLRSVTTALGARGIARLLGPVAVVTLPMVLLQLDGPVTDLPALAWLSCTAALSIASHRRPTLLPLAILAAGLGVGTKTTVVPLAGGLILVAVVKSARGGALGWGSFVSALAAIAVGGIWFIRNFALHGSPLWPFIDLGVGDRLPPLFREINGSFLRYASQTLDGRAGKYFDFISGGIVLLVGMALITLIARNRRVAIGGFIGVVSLFAWMNAPFTGDAGRENWGAVVVDTARYLMPTLAVAAIVVACASERGRRTRVTASIVLVAAIAVNVARVLSLAAQSATVRLVPGRSLLLLGALAGAVAATAVRSARAVTWRTTPVVMGVVPVLLLSLAAPGYVSRHAQTGLFDSAALGYLSRQPGYTDTTAPVAFAPATIASFAGDSFEHPISLLDEHANCDEVIDAARRGWVVIGGQFPPDTYGALFDADDCLNAITPAFETPFVRIYGPGRPTG